MTSHLDDEALSAALDEYISLAEQEHLDGCPICSERLDGLRTVSKTVGGHVLTPPPAQVDSAIAAALDASKETGIAGPWQDRPIRAGTGGHRFRAILAAAAAVVVVGGGVVALAQAVGQSPRSKTSTAQSSPIAASGSTTVPTAVAGKAGAASTTVTPGPQGLDLGSYADVDVLRSALRRLVAPGTNLSPSAPSPAVACQPRPTPPKLVASVQWRGQAAVVLVYDGGGSSARTAVVMSVPGCGPLISFAL